METKAAPGWVHLFVCVNDRQGKRASCADGDAVEVRRRLKQLAKDRGWWNQTLRISQTGCLGLCGEGPNALLHPQKIHFSQLSLDDLPQLEQALEEAIGSR